MKVWKWLLGVLVAIGGFIAMALGSSKRVKKLKKDIKATDKKVAQKKKQVKSNKKNIKKTQAKRKKIKKKPVKKKTAKKANNRLKNIGKGKK